MDKMAVKKLEYQSRNFIGNAINMCGNSFPFFEIEIMPKTSKAFDMILIVNNNSIQTHFTAFDVKGVKGIYKLASMIARI